MPHPRTTFVGVVVVALFGLGLALLTFPSSSEAQRVRSNAFDIAPRMQIDSIRQQYALEPGKELDVSGYASLVIHLGFEAADLPAADDTATLKIQTTNDLDSADWHDVASLVHTEGTTTPPFYDLVKVDIDDTEPLGQYVRWSIAFSAADQDQDVVFFVKAVGHE